MRKYIFISLIFAIFLFYSSGCGGNGNINGAIHPADNFLTGPGSSTGTFTVKIDLPAKKDLTGQVIPWQRKYLKVIFISGDGISAPVTFPDSAGHPNGQDIDAEGSTITATGIPLGLKTVRIEILNSAGIVIAQRTLGFYMERTGYNAGNIQMGIAIDSDGNCNPSSIEIGLTASPVTLYVENQGNNSRAVKINSVVNQLNGVTEAVQPDTPSVYDTKSFDFTVSGTYGIFVGNGGETDPSVHKGDVIIYSPVNITSFTPTSEQTGSEVTITGEGFDSVTPGNNTVKFNGVTAASITVDSSTQIRAIVPAGATSGKISVSTRGSTAISATDFSVFNLFLYVTAGFNKVYGYAVEANGNLTSLGNSPFTAGNSVSKITVDPSGKFLYVGNLNDLNISGYTVGNDGNLTSIGSPSATGSYPYGITIDPSGRFLYFSVSTVIPGINEVSGFTINTSTGGLTSLGSSLSTGDFPYDITVEPSGRFLYSANNYSHNISAYSINSATGALTELSGSPFTGGGLSGPWYITADPFGKFLYVTNYNTASVSAFTINTSTGSLSPVAGSPFAAGITPQGVISDPSGKFLYVANQNSSNISVYTIDGTTGALTASGSPVATGNFPRFISIDPSGKFLYVANSENNTISGYSVNQITGALTPLATPIFSTGNQPSHMAIVKKNL